MREARMSIEFEHIMEFNFTKDHEWFHRMRAHLHLMKLKERTKWEGA